jgi:hypothetical protein
MSWASSPALQQRGASIARIFFSILIDLAGFLCCVHDYCGT